MAKIDPFKVRRRSYAVVPEAPLVPYEDMGLEQGSAEWFEARFAHITASDVAAILGRSIYKNRLQVLEEKLTKREQEVSDFKRRLFEMGHLAEDAARRYANQELGKSFRPMCLKSVLHPFLMASLDGFDVSKNEILEAKYLGAKALKDVAAGMIKAHHMIQVQTQLAVSGAARCMYFAIDPAGNAEVIAIYPDPRTITEIVDACRKFYAEWQKAVK